MTLDEAIAEIEDQMRELEPQLSELRELRSLPTLAASVSGGIEALRWALQLLGQVKTAPPQSWGLP